MRDIVSSNKCENCGSEKLHKYGSGRFCSQECAKSFSTKLKRKEINKKVSQSLTGRKRTAPMSERSKTGFSKMARKAHQEKMNRPVRIRYGLVRNGEYSDLDITYKELSKYRESHQFCEICGKREQINLTKSRQRNNLSIDHDHKTNKFRGLLCSQCNYKLGWYEALKKEIEEYLRD